ncbi:MAG: minor capsid protein [candidate division Zixibacteria bacterium]|nr:minor capsid protein [candidate division Zixibacteria bacterium]
MIPLLRKLSPQYSKDSAITVTTRDAWLPEITAMLQRIISKWTSPAFRALGESIARTFVTTADDVNEKRFGINILGDDVTLQEYIQASIYDNTNLITSIPAQYLGQVESIVMTNVRSGNRSSAIIKTLQQQYGVTKRRAKMIARDQTAKVNADLSRQRQTLAGFEYFQWQDSDDSRVRDRHESIANNVTAYGKGVYRWDNPPLSDKGVPIIPGSDYQCFPGESQLNHTSLCKKFYRRKYTGELTTLVFNDGVVVRSTANHPILTDRGFKPAHLINGADNIVRTFSEGEFGIKLNGKSVVPTFEQIDSAFDLLGVKRSVATPCISEFHGDVSDGDIDIIELDRLLMDAINPSIIKKLDEFKFTRSDKVIIFQALTCFGKLDFSAVGSDTTPASVVSVLNLKLSLLLTHLSPLECFGLALGTWFDIVDCEYSSNFWSANVEVFSDTVFAFSVLVHGTDVIRERIKLITCGNYGGFNTDLLNRPMDDRFTNGVFERNVEDGGTIDYFVDRAVEFNTASFSGYVYNLESISNDYVTNTTTVSNCRCIAIPVSQAKVDENKKAGRTAPGVKR